MNLNYAIFRSEPIYTLNDLAQIGSHNKRDKKSYNSNPDINDKNKSKIKKKRKNTEIGTTFLSNNAIQNHRELSKVDKNNLRKYDDFINDSYDEDILDENDKKTQSEYYDNLDKVLIQENLIETMEGKIQQLMNNMQIKY